jgi:hypothetical protein
MGLKDVIHIMLY